MTRRRLRAGRRTVLLVAVVVAGLVSAFGPSSASPAADPPGVSNRSPNDQFPPDDAAALIGPTGLASTSYASKAKIAIQVPATYALAYVLPTTRDASGIAPAPSYYLPKNPVPGCNYQFAVDPADVYVADMTQSDRSKPAVVHSVGRFPDTRVSMLAFGSIPVTAVLHIRQQVRHGRIVPLTLDAPVSAFATLPDGTVCDAAWSGQDPQHDTAPPQPTISNGQLDTTVSDVRVDKRPIDVGANCHGTAPLEVHLIGEQPAYADNLNGGTLVQRVDRSTVTKDGSVYPLYPESRALTIPSFSGCRNRATGEDISRLITAMVSGPNNTLTVKQSVVILNQTTREKPSLCYPPDYDTQGGKPCTELPANPVALAPVH